MKFPRQQLQKYRNEPLHFEETLDLNPAIQERFSDLILSAKPVKVTGTIQMDDQDDYLLIASFHADLTLPSSRSLSPVEWATDLAIHETYVEDPKKINRFEEDEAVFPLVNNAVDLSQAVLDNIVSALPLQVLTPEEEAGAPLPEGKDWQVISEADFMQEHPVEASEGENAENDAKLDPRLAKLDDFFKK
ncbi:metal-binding protein [Fructobacillus fructosus]|uniref:YceD family protein n=1 Tax=Fructobacillus fructosus TaxID=1631 RepID=UPI0002193FEB|nr:YceD family protein [Fructobacillus fructosus]KRN51998.1 metal-binding protein [Fructobacillus fructosus KCTC 3544]GAP01655.1 metal-binding protein [Fructobacillus fructosus]